MRFTIILAFFVFQSFFLFSKGIILGNDSLVQHVFQKYNTNQIKGLAFDLSQDYNKVILHLGRKYPFSGGSFFGTQRSQNNLKYFGYLMDSLGIDFYLWFMDSYGSKMFKQMHEEHLEIIGNLKYHLNRLKIAYDGFVLDMEWINRPFGNNNDEYIEILKNVRSHFPEKQLYVFASINDDPNHNIERGFDERRMIAVVDNIIPMLYPIDGGFYLDYSMIKLRLNDRRLNDLRSYYELRNYFTAVSVEQGMLRKSWRKVNIINRVPLSDTSFNNFKQPRIYSEKYYSIYKFKALKDCYVHNDRGPNYFVKKRKKIYYFKINEAFIRQNDFIWEYDYVKKFGF